jgi:hypothetical protein
LAPSMNSAIFSICADIGSLAIVSRDKTGSAAKQSTVPVLCQKSCRHPKHPASYCRMMASVLWQM